MDFAWILALKAKKNFSVYFSKIAKLLHVILSVKLRQNNKNFRFTIT